MKPKPAGYDGFRCPACDYDLRGRKPGDDCPECGKRLEPHEVYQQRKYPGTIVVSRKWTLRVVAVLLALAAVGVFLSLGYYAGFRWAAVLGGAAVSLAAYAEFCKD